MRNSKFCWCETGRRQFVNKNNFDESVIAEFDTQRLGIGLSRTRHLLETTRGAFIYGRAGCGINVDRMATTYSNFINIKRFGKLFALGFDSLISQSHLSMGMQLSWLEHVNIEVCENLKQQYTFCSGKAVVAGSIPAVPTKTLRR